MLLAEGARNKLVLSDGEGKDDDKSLPSLRNSLSRKSTP
jgi:hypothetical protein